MVDATMGRRERKKAATRQALADAALALFLERGYDRVSIRDVAEAADVSTTTLFKHFPGKEALVFDEEPERDAALVAAVRERAPGQSIPQALREHVRLARGGRDRDERFAAFRELVRNTPALSAYAHRMWVRHQGALARAIAAEVGAAADDPYCAALARFALEAPDIDPAAGAGARSLDAAFDLLEQGWNALPYGSSPRPNAPEPEAG
ncbi:helix-turn-helix domain-containing protein [Streptomyces sp. HSW2009]|uniref:TetR/AcrR family transcriptional regulator n=1 Tax=Streptomyces sp. HSW2009 TaxID=3142890 RepID=UPI0032EFCB2B